MLSEQVWLIPRGIGFNPFLDPFLKFIRLFFHQLGRTWMQRIIGIGIWQQETQAFHHINQVVGRSPILSKNSNTDAILEKVRMKNLCLALYIRWFEWIFPWNGNFKYKNPIAVQSCAYNKPLPPCYVVVDWFKAGLFPLQFLCLDRQPSPIVVFRKYLNLPHIIYSS